MRNTEKLEPRFTFFRETPRNMMDHPPLASALQHLESSFLLLAMWRYPHALVSCGSAIESILKASIALENKNRANFKDLLKKAHAAKPEFTSLDNNVIKKFRDKRNDIIHFGFSPRDDELSAELLLNTGYQLFEDCLKTFFDLSLFKQGDKYGGLLPGFSEHLNYALKLFAKVKDRPDLSLSYCFRSFAHLIRWSTRHNSMSVWELVLLDDEYYNAASDFRQRQKDELSDLFSEYSEDLSCPVCGEYDEFICELNQDALAKSEVSLNRGICVNCNFMVPCNCPELLNLICESDVIEKKSKILKKVKEEADELSADELASVIRQLMQ